MAFAASANFKQTTWGSRAGADACDSERMVKQDNKFILTRTYNEEKNMLEKIPLTYDFTNNQALAA